MFDLTQLYHLLLLVQERINKTSHSNFSSDLTSSQVEYKQLIDLEYILTEAVERAE